MLLGGMVDKPTPTKTCAVCRRPLTHGEDVYARDWAVLDLGGGGFVHEVRYEHVACVDGAV